MSSPKETITLDPRQKNETQELFLRAGEEITIRAPEMAAGGYIWCVQVNGTGIAVLRREREAPAKGADGNSPVGGPSVAVFVIRALEPTYAEVEFIYGRPWEGKPAARHAFACDVA